MLTVETQAVPFIDLAPQDKQIGSEIRKAVLEVLDSHQFILKTNVEALEKESADYLNAPHSIGLASGSDALYLALAAAGIGPGDEVITTAFTFFATAGSIVRVGAKPVFVDIQKDTFNLNADLVEAKITKKTKAIMPVHLYGLACDMDKIMTIAKKHSLIVIEDAAQAFDADYKGKKVGTIGDFGCYSFFPTKNLGGAGDGGLITTTNAKFAERLRLLRVHGSKEKYIHEEVGINSRLDEIQAAVVRVKLRHIHEWNEKRRKIAAFYTEALKDLSLVTPVESKGCRHIYHLYSILADRRDALAQFLSQKNIGSGIYYPLPMHLQPCFKNLGGKKGDLPVTEEICSKVLSLPMYPELGMASLNRIIDAIKNFLMRS